MKVHVHIKLFATLDRYRPPDAEQRPIDAGITVAELIDQLGLPPRQVKLIFVDGRRVERDRVLSGGERVGLFPPVGGG